ncbi:anaerobic sulfatase maturase [Paenibacillus tepidiphilus]|uniref:anaerobic sulfatase maturase n=1 Tax=Paenibacillus tepidiphilus TaxID=2608683 RepID=UPI001EEF8C24|nr:anaerobic sulfatase maturase [Paenibacillus tepidiphilus]
MGRETGSTSSTGAGAVEVIQTGAAEMLQTGEMEAKWTGDVGVMWKTVSEDCNLACDYCYYSTCGGKPGGVSRRIGTTMLEAMIRQIMNRNRQVASFAWQGGEPLLAGLDFFEEAVTLQRKYARPQTVIVNSVQTNGTLITGEWAAFFKKHGFLVGVSLDGPEEIHDARRVYSSGSGSFRQVMRGIRHLQEQRVEFNILTVVHEGNVGRGPEMLRFFAEQDFHFIQFIPGMDFRAQQPDLPPQFLITPEEYGHFLCGVFDYWYNDGRPVISERFFDNLLAQHVGYPSSSCVHGEACSNMLVLEAGGEAYPCDFYMNGSYQLGNAGTDSLDGLLESPAYRQFAPLKQTVPESCSACEYFRFCHGGCPRNREWSRNGAALQPDVFCESYRRVFRYSYERMESFARYWRKERTEEWLRRGRRLPGRNDSCLCGSGRKYKKCCEGILSS